MNPSLRHRSPFASALACALASFSLALAATPAAAHSDSDGAGAAGRCRLGEDGRIRQIVHLQFDNVHLRRDHPAVPSDLEQMPNLLGFLEGQGTLLDNHHTPLISHTADDIITTLTGVYGAKHGMPVSNSYGYFNASGSVGFSSSFVYWTARAPDGQPQMVDAAGKIHPAPWVPFTRAGCDVGAFSTANIEFENITTDLITVFGAASPEVAEAASDRALATADFEGIAVHCAAGSPLCAGSSNARPDLLPDEPGGYDGFLGLFGNKYVAPRIHQGGPVTDLDGNVIGDGHGHDGFPGFNPSASQSLGYVATLLEAGVPVVYAYISDAHDNHFTGSGSYGPGEAGYVQQLAAYNAAFGKFFDRLARDGITKENTLFVISSDENDHFSGKAGAPAGCDGVNTPCTYVRLPAGCDGASVACTSTNLGEVDADLRSLLLTNYTGYPAPAFSVHSDSAPTVYVKGHPGATDAVTRDLEHRLAALQAYNPNRGASEPVMRAMADGAQMQILHMVTSDAARTPTFTLFADPDFYLFATAAGAACTSLEACSNQQPGFNWNHGDFQKDITRTWMGMVGPGVRHLGRTGEFFSDHTDTRPTMMALTGLVDDYDHDGRVLAEVIAGDDRASGLRGESFTRLAAAYKAINAPVGPFGLRTLRLATRAIAGDDAGYAAWLGRAAALAAQRDALASRMIALLEGAAFHGQSIDEGEAQALIGSARGLLDSVEPRP